MEQNLSLYRIFYMVANTGSISRAASELFISQPAVSKAVQKLEQSLNTTLFLRSSRGASLTEEGQIIYDHIKSAFSSIQLGEEKVKRYKDLNMGHIRIGVSTTLCRFTLLPFLETFIRNHPHIRITIECQSSNRTLQLLTENEIDLGLIGRVSCSFPASGRDRGYPCRFPVIPGQSAYAGRRSVPKCQSDAFGQRKHYPPVYGRLSGVKPYFHRKRPGSIHHGSSDRVCKNRPWDRLRHQTVCHPRTDHRGTGGNPFEHTGTEKTDWLCLSENSRKKQSGTGISFPDHRCLISVKGCRICGSP